MNSIEKMVAAALVRGGAFAEIARQVSDTETQMRIAPSGSKGEALLKSTHVAQLTALQLALSLRAQLDQIETALTSAQRELTKAGEVRNADRAAWDDIIDSRLASHGLIKTSYSSNDDSDDFL